MTKNIKLGSKVTDPITGYIGIVMARTKYLHGCDRIGCQAEIDTDGKVPELEWFDELRLKSLPADRKKGGPQPTPAKKIDPK